MHKHVDDPFYRQKCGDHITLRSVSIASYELGLYRMSDVIELRSAYRKKIPLRIQNILKDGYRSQLNTSGENPNRTK